MYSSVNNHDKSKPILSLQELVGIIAVFSFLLYLLFPKGNIEDFLESQGDNTNLSINYLQSLILYHPNNVELKMILMKKYTLIGKEEKALKINLALIQKSSKKKFLTELYKIEYLLNKALYFKIQNPETLKLLKEKLLAYYQYTKNERDYFFFFSESTNIDYGYLKYHSLINFMKENPELIDYELEKMAFDLANQLDYKEEAYTYLQRLIKYPNISEALKEHLIYSLFEHRQFTKAKEITTKLFLKSKSDDELTKYFHLALYALVQDKNKSNTEVSQLIQDYANLKKLLSPDIVIILNTLLELGDSKEAANFAINMFYTDPESFDQTGIDLALQSLLYHSELEEARALSFFAESKFRQQKYLDKTILISAWLGEAEAVEALNEKGYYQYKAPVYEKYFLQHENLDSNYKILGLIYKKKIQNREYKYIDNMARYYDYTGEINKAERYFTKLSQQKKHKRLAYYAIEFSYKNSHFEKGLTLYNNYHSNYGINARLQELSIQKLLVLKRFNEAYLMTKALNTQNFIKKEQRFMDLAWLEKDYAFLHQKLWRIEEKKNLNQEGFVQLILLEKALNKSAKVNYLYKRAWKKTHNSYYLSSLMYKLLEKKDFKQVNTIIRNLSQHEKNILNKNIEFQILLADYYVQNSKIRLALKHYDKIFKINPHKITSHQSYLWFLLDNKKKSSELSKRMIKHLSYLQKHPSLRKKIGIASVVIAMTNKRYKLANYWLKKLMQDSPNNKEYQSLAKDIRTIKSEKLYTLYDKMLNEEYLENKVSIKKKYLGNTLQVDETSFSHQWKLYKNLKAKIMLKHYAYKGIEEKRSKQTHFDISLQNSKNKFLWDLHLGTLKAKKNTLSASLDLGYSIHNIQVNLNAKYQNKTELTPKLEQNALENALELKIQAHLNPRSSFAFLLEESKFTTLDKVEVGTAKKLQISANYILRSGYPNISFNTYLSHNRFSKNISENFSELGIATSIGNIRQNTLNSSWKPFGTFSLALNNEHNLGSSLVLGISKALNGDDSLDLLFNYYNGIGVINEPIYGFNVKYRF